MIQTIDLRNSAPASDLSRIIPRAQLDVASATAVAAGLIDDVRAHGAAAVLPVDEIIPVMDTVLVRPDPVPAAA